MPPVTERLKEDVLKRCSSNLDICSLIGNEQKGLTLYMNYCTFEYLSQAKRIGDTSANGFNFLMTYTRDFNTDKRPHMVQSSSVLKSARDMYADNLLYEYIVGNWLNQKISSTLPFFVCTHGLFVYKSENAYKSTKRLYDTRQLMNTETINDVLELRHSKGQRLTDTDFQALLQLSYATPTRLCILIEAVPNPKSFEDVLDTMDVTFFKYDLVPILFQVYGALHKLTDLFTHNDLHLCNVLLTQLPDSYFCYSINTGDTIHSRYMVKIIDYGRCYSNVTKDMIKRLCRSVPQLQRKRICDPLSIDMADLRGYGYAVRQPERPNAISCIERNRSSDLKLLHQVLNVYNGMISRYLHGLSVFRTKVQFDGTYSTRERENGYSNNKHNPINTVSDAFFMLLDLIRTDNYTSHYKEKHKQMNVTIEF